MAKRKRLDPLPQGLPDMPEASAGPAALWADSPGPAARPPIAHVAGDGAQAAALSELAEALDTARSEGRLILRLPLASVDEGYLLRDRLGTALAEDDAEMAELTASLAERGQQVAIEVADLGPGRTPRYGLIAGWRRLTALRRLADGGQGPGTVLAIARPPTEAASAYRAMVEENEIRAGLSYYERARIVARATDAGAFPDDRAALSALFSAASRPRRSKIGSFLRIVRALDGALVHPAALNERTGLALATALDRDEGLAQRLISALEKAPPPTPAAETALIARVIAGQATIRGRREKTVDTTAPGLRLAEEGPARLVLEGDLLRDTGFRQRLLDWIARNSH